MNACVVWMLIRLGGLNAFRRFLNNTRKGHARYGPCVSWKSLVIVEWAHAINLEKP